MQGGEGEESVNYLCHAQRDLRWVTVVLSPIGDDMQARGERYEHPLVTFTKMMCHLGPHAEEVKRFYLPPNVDEEASKLLGFARRMIRASIAIKVARNRASDQERVWAKSDKDLVAFARLVLKNYERATKKLTQTPKGPESRGMEAVIIQWNILRGAAHRKVLAKHS